MDSQTLTAIISAAGGLAVATAGAIVKGALAQRAGLDEELRGTRTKLYPAAWRNTAAISQWPKSELTWGGLRALHKDLRNWYYGEAHPGATDPSPGGLYLSRNSQKRYADMQGLIDLALPEAAHDHESVPDEYYEPLRAGCSAFRTALTEDLETRRKRSVWWTIETYRLHQKQAGEAATRTSTVTEQNKTRAGLRGKPQTRPRP